MANKMTIVNTLHMHQDKLEYLYSDGEIIANCYGIKHMRLLKQK